MRPVDSGPDVGLRGVRARSERALATVFDVLTIHALAIRKELALRERILHLLGELHDVQELERRITGTPGDLDQGGFEEPVAGYVHVALHMWHAAKEREHAEVRRDADLEDLDDGMRACLAFDALPEAEQARQWAACTPQATAG